MIDKSKVNSICKAHEFAFMRIKEDIVSARKIAP